MPQPTQEQISDVKALADTGNDSLYFSEPWLAAVNQSSSEFFGGSNLSVADALVYAYQAEARAAAELGMTPPVKNAFVARVYELYQEGAQ